jgi:hypothetical protein
VDLSQTIKKRAPLEIQEKRSFWYVIRLVVRPIDHQTQPIWKEILEKQMATNLPKNTEEGLKKDRFWNRVILVLIAIALAGMVYVVVDHYTSEEDGKTTPVQGN